MSLALARFLYRFRLAITFLIVAGALALAPRAQITRIDNDISAWFSKDDPVLRDYDRLRQEFTGSRTLIVALAGPGVTSAAGLDVLRRITADVERVPYVIRAYSLASANTIRATGGEDAGIEVRPLIPRAGPIDAGTVVKTALADPFLRGDLIARDASVVSLVVNFDEDRVDAERAQTIERIRAVVDRHLTPDLRAYYNGSLEISETYNRVTVANTIRVHAADPADDAGGAVHPVPFVADHRADPRRGAGERAVVARAVLPDGVQLQRAEQHAGAARRGAGHRRRRAHHPALHRDLRRTGSREEAFVTTVAELFLPLLAASGTTALGMFSLATSHVHAVSSFGIGAAVGVMTDMAISIVLVPTLLAWCRGARPFRRRSAG